MKTYRIKSVIAAIVAVAASVALGAGQAVWADLTGPKPPATSGQGK